MRIISTVPSQTELLYDLGLEEEVVGITKFCVHPKRWYREKERIGGTKNLHIDKIHALKPDIIIANKEENTKEQIEALSMYTVHVMEVKTLEDNTYLIETLSEVCNVKVKGNQLVSKFKESLDKLYAPTFTEALYFIWKDPFMTVGGDTYIHSMMEHIGVQNQMSQSTRYPEISKDTIKQLKPELLLFSSEPYPFQEKHIQKYTAKFPSSRSLIVDGEFFSWYGTRLIKMLDYGLELKQTLEKLLDEP